MDQETNSVYQQRPLKKMEESLAEKANITAKVTNYEVQSLHECSPVTLELDCKTTVANV